MLGLPDTDLALLTTKQCQARLHVDFLGALQPEKLQAKIDASGRWTHAVGFRPTGTRPHTTRSAQALSRTPKQSRSFSGPHCVLSSDLIC